MRAKETNPIKLIPKIDKELKSVERDIVTQPRIEEKQNKVLTYKMLILGVIIGVFGNIVANSIWEPPATSWQQTIMVLAALILVGTIIYFFEQLRKFES
jgi:preprotein translocase subunit SecE